MCVIQVTALQGHIPGASHECAQTFKTTWYLMTLPRERSLVSPELIPTDLFYDSILLSLLELEQLLDKEISQPYPHAS